MRRLHSSSHGLSHSEAMNRYLEPRSGAPSYAAKSPSSCAVIWHDPSSRSPWKHAPGELGDSVRVL